MSGQVEIGGVWKPITSAQVYIGNAWRRVTRGQYYNGTTWKTISTFVSPLSIAASPTFASGAQFHSRPQPSYVVSNPVTVTPTGGLAPFTYAWTCGTAGVVITGSATSTATFAANVPNNGDIETTASVICTDHLGATASLTIDVSLTNQSDL